MSSQFENGAGIRDLLNNLQGKWPLILIMGKQDLLPCEKVAKNFSR